MDIVKDDGGEATTSTEEGNTNELHEEEESEPDEQDSDDADNDGDDDGDDAGDDADNDGDDAVENDANAAENDRDDADNDGDDGGYDDIYEDVEEDESQPPPPEVFFEETYYNKGCKIGSRFLVTQTVEYIETFEEEVSWFKKHSQFKHVFHMPREPNHMVQGMWMLLLRTASTNMDRECWFVVNGVPIRYSLKEHALLTGFDCYEYPPNYKKKIGGWEFARRMFKRIEKIKIKDVEAKLKKMKSKSSTDRVRMTILYFLCKVVKASSKDDGNIDPFLLRVVDDLEAVEKFPWGRYSFDECMKGIRRVMKNMKRSVKEKAQTSFCGFIVPLEILAFECIPHLGDKFREVIPAERDCPRMCKHKFTESCMKGFTLEEINAAAIISILEPDMDEKHLLTHIIDDGFDDGIGVIDPLVDSWRDRLIVQKKKIWWKGLYKLDLAGRSLIQVPETANEIPEIGNEIQDMGASIRSLKEAMEKGFEEITNKLAGLNDRMEFVEMYVSSQLDKEAERVIYCQDTPMNYGPRTPTTCGQEKSHDNGIVQGTPNDPVSAKAHEGQEKNQEKGKEKDQEKEKENEKDEENENEKDQEEMEEEVEIEEQEKIKEQEKKKVNTKKKGKEKNDNVTLIETGKKRRRAPSKLLKTPYTRGGKQQRK
ncbi:PREDICTED: uncharacterized protein At3g43530-like [Camelina sativa]|uniref:Uncharacterized protein At3g43530-like n=1 Tax=Camelina sativa TaxID=90675 RepID=A0ABM1REC8_CAMSA|nr:PREDICTED: uncharacterized protein At3g43530-like [Camelina sativa]